MERRAVLKKALTAGGALVVFRLSGLDEAAEAATPAAQFQEGHLEGGKFTGWKALLATTGKAVYGTIFDPNTVEEGRFTGYRVRGVKNGKKLILEFFELDDVNFSKPVGDGKGKKRGGTTTTDFEIGNALAGKKGAAIVSEPAPVSSRETRQQAGSYLVELRNEAGELRAEFDLTIARDGKFTITNLYAGPHSEGVPGKIAGRLGVSGDEESLYTLMALPKSLGTLGSQVDLSEVNLFKRVKGPSRPGTDPPDDVATWVEVLWGCLCGIPVR